MEGWTYIYHTQHQVLNKLYLSCTGWLLSEDPSAVSHQGLQLSPWPPALWFERSRIQSALPRPVKGITLMNNICVPISNPDFPPHNPTCWSSNFYSLTPLPPREFIPSSLTIQNMKHLKSSSHWYITFYNNNNILLIVVWLA